MKNKPLKNLQDDIRSKFGKTKSGGISKVTKSRKARRKQARREKKGRRLAYYAKKQQIPLTPTSTGSDLLKKKEIKKKQKREPQQEVENKQKNKLVQKRELEKPVLPAVKKQKKDAVAAREERELQQLEKYLKMKKKKSLPKAFIDDGLDYLLDVVDKNKLKALSPDNSDNDSDSDDGDHDYVASDTGDDKSGDDDEGAEGSVGDTPVMKTKDKNKGVGILSNPMKPKKKKTVKHVHFTDDVPDNESEESAVKFDSEDDIDSDGSAGSEAEEEEKEITSEKEPHEQVVEESDEEAEEEKMEGESVREDIYGRLLDAKGNVIPAVKQHHLGNVGGSTYIPPAKRAAMLQGSEHNAAEKEKVKKQMKGLLNRASESNMQSIAGAIENLYMNHSRAAVNETLFALIMDACVSEVMSPDRFLAEMSMLISILHGNIGSEVGSFFMEHLVKKFEAQRQLESYGQGHTVDNILLLMAYLYNFKVAHHCLMFDILGQLVEKFGDKDIELILLLLKAAGFSLRKDDPAALGQQISAVQKKAQELGATETDSSSRIRYMLDILLAVRNNNVRRVTGADTERIDRLRRLAGSFIRGSGLSDNQLNVGLRDFLHAEEAGRWWLVGSAWDGRSDRKSAVTSSTASTSASSKVSSVVGTVSQKLMDVARKLHMNSDVRRSIFFVLMSSEDYLDAFQKVLQLGVKGQQEREIVVVAVECCKRETQYNPYYSYFLARLATHDRRFMMALQFHMWDVFKTLSEASSSARHNVALMLAHLLSCQALPLSVLKVLEFGALGKVTEGFLRTALVRLLTSTPTSDVEGMFRRVGQQVRLQHLAQGLRVFLAGSLKVKKLVDVDRETLKKHLAVASAELSVGVRTVL